MGSKGKNLNMKAIEYKLLTISEKNIANWFLGEIIILILKN
jgi:hypothetical protein